MQPIFDRLQTVLTDATTQAYEKMVDILPQAAWAILIVIAGWLFASLVYYVCKRILEFFAVDKLVGKTPLDRLLRSIGFRKSISEIISLLVFWMAVLATLILASEVLNLTQVSAALLIVTKYIPQVIAALLIIVFGMLLAKFLQTVVSQALSQADVAYAKSLGRVVQMTVLIFVIIAASEQLGFDLSFVTTNVMMGVFAAIVLLGVGLIVAGRTTLENMIACQRLRHVIRIGDHISINTVSGTVQSVSLTGIVLKSGEGQTVVPALSFLTSTYTIRSSHASNG